jgi:parallel beta-helix repeat protein
MKKLFAHLLLAACAMLLSVASYGQTAISSVPYTISQPGYYVLAKDLFYPYFYANAVTMTASNVTLDFAGHVLAGVVGGMPNPPFGTTPNQAVAVLITTSGSTAPSNVTVKNGTITGNSVGINISAPGQGHVVEGMRLESQTNTGISIQGGSGCLISSNYISNSGTGTYGIWDDSDGSTQIIRNRAVNSETGIASAQGYLESNFVSNCTTGFFSGNPKLRFNTTVNCREPFYGGVLVTDDNN